MVLHLFISSYFLLLVNGLTLSGDEQREKKIKCPFSVFHHFLPTNVIFFKAWERFLVFSL